MNIIFIFVILYFVVATFLLILVLLGKDVIIGDTFIMIYNFVKWKTVIKFSRFVRCKIQRHKIIHSWHWVHSRDVIIRKCSKCYESFTHIHWCCKLTRL